MGIYDCAHILWTCSAIKNNHIIWGTSSHSFILFDVHLSGANQWPRSGGQSVLPSSYENSIQPLVKICFKIIFSSFINSFPIIKPYPPSHLTISLSTKIIFACNEMGNGASLNFVNAFCKESFDMLNVICFWSELHVYFGF